jgi:hypothetical protein
MQYIFYIFPLLFLLSYCCCIRGTLEHLQMFFFQVLLILKRVALKRWHRFIIKGCIQHWVENIFIINLHFCCFIKHRYIMHLNQVTHTNLLIYLSFWPFKIQIPLLSVITILSDVTIESLTSKHLLAVIDQPLPSFSHLCKPSFFSQLAWDQL